MIKLDEGKIGVLNRLVEDGEVEAGIADYGILIQIARQQHDISAMDLSKKVGVASSTLSKMESDSSPNIQLTRLIAVAEGLGLEILIKFKLNKDEES